MRGATYSSAQINEGQYDGCDDDDDDTNNYDDEDDDEEEGVDKH